MITSSKIIQLRGDKREAIVGKKVRAVLKALVLQF